MTILRQASLGDLPEMKELFVGTIMQVCANDYDEAQRNAWVASVENEKRWHDLVAYQHVLVAVANEKILGFASLDGGNYIDMLYVHKDHQMMGIAGTLYEALEKEAIKLGNRKLSSDVSITARPFFERRGFRLFTTQTKKRNGVELVNFRMEKEL